MLTHKIKKYNLQEAIERDTKMKLSQLFLFLFLLCSILAGNLYSQMLIKPDGDGTSINPNAMLQIESSTKGFLIPRMTSAQRTAISNPPQGLLVFQTDGGDENSAPGLYYATGTGNNWSLIFHSNTSAITGNGSQNYIPYWTATNVLGNSGMYWDNTNGRLGIGTTSPTGKLHIVDATTNSSSILISKTGAITGNSFGVYSTVSGATTWSEGIYAKANGTGTNNVGVVAGADGVATNNYGIKSEVSNGTTYNYGIHTLVSGSTGTTYGGYFQNTSTTTSKKYGVYSEVTGVSAAINYGVFGVSSGSTDRNYGVLGFSNTAGTGTNIGGYFIASGSSTANYGLIVQDGNVGIGTTTPAYKLDISSTSGSDRQDMLRILAGSNATGNGSSIVLGSTQTHAGYISGLQTASNTGDLTFGIQSSGSYVEKMRIVGSTGNVGIGTTAPSFQLHVTKNSGNYIALIQNLNNTTGSHGLDIQAGSSSTGGAFMVGFYRPDGTNIGSITQNTATTVAYNTTSDRRLKDNIVNTHFGINDLMKIQVRDYFYKADPNKTPTTGFIAQELYDIFPNAVTKPANEEEMWSIDYGKVTPLLTKAIQEQQSEIENLKIKNKDYEDRLSKLESKGQFANTSSTSAVFYSLIGLGFIGIVFFGIKNKQS